MHASSVVLGSRASSAGGEGGVNAKRSRRRGPPPRTARARDLCAAIDADHGLQVVVESVFDMRPVAERLVLALAAAAKGDSVANLVALAIG